MSHGSVSHMHLEDLVSLHLCVSRPSIGPGTEQIAEMIC